MKHALIKVLTLGMALAVPAAAYARSAVRLDHPTAEGDKKKDKKKDGDKKKDEKKKDGDKK
jgi:hypothetical protein